MKASRVFITSGIVAALIGFIGFVPLPHRVFGPLEMQPYDPAPIYAAVPGRVVEVGPRYGDDVADGMVVARLENRDIDLAVEELTARRDRQRAELAALRREQFDSPNAALSIPRVEKLLESIEDQLQEKLRDQARLTLSAARGGTLFPPADVPDVADNENLQAWSGRVLDPINRGCTVEVGTLLGQIGDPRLWQALIVLDQEDVEFVLPGDKVEIVLDALPERIFRGTVDEVAIGEMRDAPRRLSNKAGGELATKEGTLSAERPISTSYQVRVRIDDPAGELRVGWRGTARVQAAPMSLGSRLLRSFSRTFHFHL
jgi:multidrug resistance efflux pump